MENINESHVEVRQDFNVPAQEVYDAWTNPDQLKQWWKPLGNTLTEVKNELKEGGKIDYVFEENKLHISGDYIKFKENELLEYTWNWQLPHDPIKNSSYKLSVQFKGEGNESHIQITQDALADKEGMLIRQEGWKKALEDLSNYLNDKK